MPEIKGLIVICYFTVLIAFGAAFFIVAVQIPSESIFNYFLCESAGKQPGTPCVITKKTTIAVLSTAFVVLLQLYPGVNLVYAVNIKSVRKTYVNIKSVRKKYVNMSTP